MSLTRDAVPVRTPARLRPARLAAGAAAVLLLVGGTVALFTDAAADHTRGAGAVSEVLTGMAFLAGAVALALLTPVRGWRLVLWALVPFNSILLAAVWGCVALTAGRHRDTQRDRGLLRLLARGRSTDEIARELFLAPKTIRNRLSELYAVLGVNNRAEAVAAAYELGM